MKRTKKTIKVRRKREKKTDYKKRIGLLLNPHPRVVVRKSKNSLYAQIINYDPQGDKILVTASSKELSKYGWNAHPGNMPASYLTGLVLATRAKKQNIKNAIPDLGLHRVVKGSCLFAVLKGVRDGGLEIPLEKKAIPSEDRIKGQHIVSYKEKKEAQSEFQFNVYKKKNTDPGNIPNLVEEIKKKIMS